MKEKSKLPRREFLANLLFAGGALTVCGLQSSYGLVARRDPKEDGWELPDDLKDSQPDEEPDGWDLPDDLMDSPPVIQNPQPPPQPPIRGRVVPPTPEGSVAPPGDVSPPIKGKFQAPRPD